MYGLPSIVEASKQQVNVRTKVDGWMECTSLAACASDEMAGLGSPNYLAVRACLRTASRNMQRAACCLHIPAGSPERTVCMQEGNRRRKTVCLMHALHAGRTRMMLDPLLAGVDGELRVRGTASFFQHKTALCCSHAIPGRHAGLLAVCSRTDFLVQSGTSVQVQLLLGTTGAFSRQTR